MTKLKPYPEYKDAGVPWLEDVPECWPVVSTRVALRPMKVLAGTDPSKHQLLSLTKQGVIPRDMENAQGKHPKNYDTYQVVDIDDLIFCLFDIDETPRTVGLVKEPGMLTGAYTRFKTTTAADQRFICWYFLALDNGKRLKPLYTGLRKIIQKTRFLSAPMPLPELKVQRAIADFLDRETAQIDELIGKQKRLIELLAEKRQAIITHAVTKGLDPNAPTKPSGVPWLGEVPKHWTMTKFRYFARILGGNAPEQCSPQVSGAYPYIKVSSLNALDGNQEVSSTEEYIDTASFTCPAGTVLFPKRGAAIFTNKVGVVRTRSAFDTNLMGLELDQVKAHGLFIVHWLRSRTLNELADTSTLPQINNKHIYPLEIALPPLREQKKILEVLGLKLRAIDVLARKCEVAVRLLQERRTALISAAVTGKIKVDA